MSMEAKELLQDLILAFTDEPEGPITKEQFLRQLRRVERWNR